MGVKICIDPGHGGYDSGAVGPTGLKEKDVTLDVALRLRKYLQRVGIEVVITRTGDDVVWSKKNDLEKRVFIANYNRVNYFVSLHCNASKAITAWGTECYCYKYGGEGEKLARSIQKAIVSSLLLPDRGVKEANFYVLRKTVMPAVLVEMDFISNPKSEEQMRRENWRQAMALCIASGVCNYLGLDKPWERDEDPKIERVPEWKEKIMEWGRKNLNISAEHRPDEPAPKWFVIELIRRAKEGV